MAQELTILLIEDDQIECDAIRCYVDGIDESDDIRLVGITNSVAKGLEHVKDYYPDAIILDLELHKGSGNGLSFLRELKQLELPVRPYVLVTTNNISAITHNEVRQCGADFIMVKSQSDYSAKTAVEFLRALKSTLHSNSHMAGFPLEMATTESPAQISKRIIKRINSELNYVSISPKVKGRQYLVDAIEMLIKGHGNNITATIAERYSKSTASVERTMQYAIDQAWRTTDIDELCKYYTAFVNPSKGVPTITEFIYYYANKIKIND